MIGVFVTFIRVVYGRMIYMSLPIHVVVTFRSSGVFMLIFTELTFLSRGQYEKDLIGVQF